VNQENNPSKLQDLTFIERKEHRAQRFSKWVESHLGGDFECQGDGKTKGAKTLNH